MGRTRGMGKADFLGDELRWYFGESESDLGVSSSFGAFVDLAMSGIQGGGRRNGVLGRMAAIADKLDRPMRRHRRWRERILALHQRDPRLLDVLWAAYGPTDWRRVADRAFGIGTGERMIVALGANHLGIALLTERLAQVHAKEVAMQEAGAVPVAPGMLLAALVKAARPNKTPKTAAQREARDAARKVIGAIAIEARMVLELARDELSPRSSDAHPPRARSTPRAPRRARPQVIFELPTAVVNHVVPARAGAQRWL